MINENEFEGWTADEAEIYDHRSKCIAIAQAARESGMGFHCAAAKVGISASTLARWRKACYSDAPRALLPKKSPGRPRKERVA